MTPQEALVILEQHQYWRVGGDTEPTDPKKLTVALYVAIQMLKKNDPEQFEYFDSGINSN